MKKLLFSLAVISGLLLSGCGHFRKSCGGCDSCVKSCPCSSSKDAKDTAGGCQDCKDKK